MLCERTVSGEHSSREHFSTVGMVRWTAYNIYEWRNPLIVRPLFYYLVSGRVDITSSPADAGKE